ncbi:MAG: hypothetical protein LM517_05170 [Nitrosomonas sp.]|nr:hypothetical protein [Nitrosomonas sp.]
MNSWLEARYLALWPEIQHPDYVGITLVDALEQEQLYLMPMPAPFDGYIEVLAGVSSTCLVTLLHNRYFPCLAVWPIKWLPVIEKKPGALRNGAPLAELPAPFLQLQTALRRRERQQVDRIMAKVLSLVPTHGLEAVLVAVETHQRASVSGNNTETQGRTAGRYSGL